MIYLNFIKSEYKALFILLAFALISFLGIYFSIFDLEHFLNIALKPSLDTCNEVSWIYPENKFKLVLTMFSLFINPIIIVFIIYKFIKFSMGDCKPGLISIPLIAHYLFFIPMHFFIAPQFAKQFGTYSISEQVTNSIYIESFFTSYMLNSLIFYLALISQMPKNKVLYRGLNIKNILYGIAIIGIICIIITPPDSFSTYLTAIPFVMFYLLVLITTIKKSSPDPNPKVVRNTIFLLAVLSIILNLPLVDFSGLSPIQLITATYFTAPAIIYTFVTHRKNLKRIIQ